MLDPQLRSPPHGKDYFRYQWYIGWYIWCPIRGSVKEVRWCINFTRHGLGKWLIFLSSVIGDSIRLMYLYVCIAYLHRMSQYYLLSQVVYCYWVFIVVPNWIVPWCLTRAFIVWPVFEAWNHSYLIFSTQYWTERALQCDWVYIPVSTPNGICLGALYAAFLAYPRHLLWSYIAAFFSA